MQGNGINLASKQDYLNYLEGQPVFTIPNSIQRVPNQRNEVDATETGSVKTLVGNHAVRPRDHSADMDEKEVIRPVDRG